MMNQPQLRVQKVVVPVKRTVTTETPETMVITEIPETPETLETLETLATIATIGIVVTTDQSWETTVIQPF